MVVILITIILWSDKKAGLSKSQIGRDRDQLSGNLHTSPPHNVPPQGFVKSVPEYLSKPAGNICQNQPCLTQRRKDWCEKGPTELHRGWPDSFSTGSWETLFDILNKLSTGDTAAAGDRFSKHFWQIKVVTCWDVDRGRQWRWLKRFSHWYVEARMHPGGSEVVHVSVVAPYHLDHLDDDINDFGLWQWWWIIIMMLMLLLLCCHP